MNDEGFDNYEARYRSGARKKAIILVCAAFVLGVMGCFASPGINLIVFSAGIVEAIFARYWAERSKRG